ncbi:MAG TPA: hypothetical protein ENK95_01940 [Campylobacterales bacterium]|nr:hypothetical protein [Campylobacterales bacterium]
MINKIKNLPTMTKVLYVITFLLFIAWVLPTANRYFSNLNKYQTDLQEIENISSKYDIDTPVQKFSKENFKQTYQVLFTKIEIQDLGDKLYLVDIEMKKEDLNKFHSFLETLALKYYVQIEEGLAFTTKENAINVRFKLKAL